MIVEAGQSYDQGQDLYFLSGVRKSRASGSFKGEKRVLVLGMKSRPGLLAPGKGCAVFARESWRRGGTALLK